MWESTYIVLCQLLRESGSIYCSRTGGLEIGNSNMILLFDLCCFEVRHYWLDILGTYSPSCILTYLYSADFALLDLIPGF